jgi:predicted amidophosphoribosyltransferase
MSLKVVAFCGYFCNRVLMRRPEDHDAHKFIQAIKAKSMNMYGYVPVRGVKQRLSNDNAADAVGWFATFVLDHLTAKKLKGPFLVVPVPNSDTTLSSSSKPRTKRLAKAICDVLNDGSKVVDCLRVKQDLGSASEDRGPRAANVLYGNLALLRDVVKGVDKDAKVLLVDDVTTSGGHLQACAAKLATVGLEVDMVMCAGKTVYDQDERAFHTYEYKLDQYEP